MMDANVLNVIEKYRNRAVKGFEKYGVDTTRHDLNTFDWLNHLQEELMDATVYIERLKCDLSAAMKGPIQMEMFKNNDNVISEFVNDDRYAQVIEVPGGYQILCEEDGKLMAQYNTVSTNLAEMEAKAEDFVMRA